MSVETIGTTVLEVFRDVLKNSELGEDTDFFEAGGDSLLAIDAIQRIGEDVGLDLDPVVIFMYPTPASCAGAVADLG
ncbi:phosphopantetheine-binding protein [Saccharothrix luteola]|jgi:acyl carrier protein|uniref:phosphopantetheine-binding protein n=1 Tax=Saccharothrix luteola TaxID=2893018 RepID=UPI001E587205|nr:phosphopantetheine-binding protein [Saccharothrix luteola]MCC8250844.1 phosphopantetheine-binding protein [Saccharothrix luteola]